MKHEILRVEYVYKKMMENEILFDLNLNLFKGEILCVLARNSTERHCIRDILLGKINPDKGTVYIDDEEVILTDEPSRFGIHGIYKISTLVQSMNIVDNMFSLTPSKNLFEPINYKRLLSKTAAFLDSVGLSHLSPYTLVHHLDIPTLHVIEILKAIATGCKILVLDNIVNNYSEKNINILNMLLKQCVSKGISIIIMTNKYSKVIQSVDRVSIIRDGTVVATIPNGEVTKELLTNLSAGYPVNETHMVINNEKGEKILSWQDVMFPGIPHGLCFDVMKGEIVSIYLSEWEYGICMADALYGDSQYSGQIKLFDSPVNIQSIRDTIRYKIAVVREDMDFIETFNNMNLIDNTTIMLRTNPYFSLGMENRRIKKFMFNKVLKIMGIPQLIENNKPEDMIPLNINKFSQLKIYIAKWLCINPRIVLFVYPDLCLDDVTIHEFKNILHNISINGISVIILSINMNFLLQIGGRLIAI